jgi:hypothetical protein
VLKFEQCYCYIINQSRFGSVDNEFMQIAEKIIPENVAKNTFFGNIPEVILPKNEAVKSSLHFEDLINKETRTAAIVAKKVDTLTETVSPEIVAGYH